MASFNVASIFASLGLKTDEASFVRGQLVVDGIRKALSMLGEVAHAVTDVLKESTLGVYEHADALDDLATKTGVSSATLQELGYVGQFTDTSIESLSQGMKILQRNMVDAVEGNKDLQGAFHGLVTLVDPTTHKLRGTEDVLMDLVDRFSDMPESAKKTQLMMKLLGKSGGELTGVFNLGSDGIREYVQEFRQLGGELSDSTIAGSSKLEDNFIRLKTAMQGVKNTIAEALLPVFNDLVGDTLEWVKANQDLIRTKIREYVLDAVDAVKNFVKNVREWIKEQGGLGAVVEKVGGYLKAFGVLLAAIKVAGFLSSVASMIAALKALGMTIATGLGLAGLAGEIILVAGLIYENWDDIRGLGMEIRYLFEDIGKAIVNAFSAAIDWVAEKIDWVVNKFHAVEGLLDKINPFSIDDTSSSGTRGVADDLSPEATKILQRRGKLQAFSAGAPGFVPSTGPGGSAGGAGVTVVNSPNISVVQQPGEDGVLFAQRVAKLTAEQQQRTMREAAAGSIY